MAEQTFRSPGFFEQEIDLSARRATPLGIPAGVTAYVYATQWESWPTEAYAVMESQGYYIGVAWLYTGA